MLEKKIIFFTQYKERVNMLFFKIHVSKAVEEGLLPMLGLFWINAISMTMILI